MHRRHGDMIPFTMIQEHASICQHGLEITVVDAKSHQYLLLLTSVTYVAQLRPRCTLPKARICLVAAENNQEAKNECISSPYGLDAPSSANRLCHGVPQKHV